MMELRSICLFFIFKMLLIFSTLEEEFGAQNKRKEKNRLLLVISQFNVASKRHVKR